MTYVLTREVSLVLSVSIIIDTTVFFDFEIFVFFGTNCYQISDIHEKYAHKKGQPGWGCSVLRAHDAGTLRIVECICNVSRTKSNHRINPGLKM